MSEFEVPSWAERPAAPQSAHTLQLAYADASIILIEGLMHLLLERKVADAATLIALVEAAVETKRGEIAAGQHPEIAIITVGVLSRIGNSLAASTANSR